MTPSQYAILSFIHEYLRGHDGRLPSPEAVRKGTQKSDATLHRALDYLEAEGFLIRGRQKLGRAPGGGTHSLNVVLTDKELPPPPPPPAPRVSKPFRGRTWYRDRNDEILRRMKEGESVAVIADALHVSTVRASQLCRRIADRKGIPWGRQLLDAQAHKRNQQIARRMLEGADQSMIASEFGLSENLAADLWRTIGRTLVSGGAASFRQFGLETDERRRQEDAEVLSRLNAGETHRQIGAALGRTSAWVSIVRARLGMKVRNYLHVSQSEHEEILSRVLGGEKTSAIATDMEVDKSTVLDHSASVRQITRYGPRSAVKPGRATRPKARRRIEEYHLQQIEADLRSGLSMRQIGKRLGLSHSTIQDASRDIRQALTESGVMCGCGRPLGHTRLCAVTAKSTRTIRNGEITKRHVRHMEERLLAGQTLRQISDALNFTHQNVSIATKAFREEMFEQGVTCGCGKIMGHPHCCKFNIKRRKTWTGGGLTAIGKRRVRLALVEGHHLADIVRDLDVAELSVLQMRKALTPAERQQRKQAMRDRGSKPAEAVRNFEVSEEEFRALIEHATPFLRDRAERYAKRLGTCSKDDLMHDLVVVLWSTRHTFKRDYDERPIEERFQAWSNRILYMVFVKAYWADGGGRMQQAPELSAQSGHNERRDFLSDMIVDTTSAALLDEMDFGADGS